MSKYVVKRLIANELSGKHLGRQAHMLIAGTIENPLWQNMGKITGIEHIKNYTIVNTGSKGAPNKYHLRPGNIVRVYKKVK